MRVGCEDPPLSNRSRLDTMVQQRPPIIGYLTSRFPAESETFVYREVAELRRRGWVVHTFGLHHSQPLSSQPLSGDTLNKFADTTPIAYDNTAAVLVGAIIQMLCHPLRSLRTLTRVLGDAIHPAETTSLAERAKLFVQFLAALRLGRLLRKQHVEHLHCHFAHSPTTVGMYAAKFAGISFSFTGHANDLFERRALLKRKLQRAAFVVAISAWHREFYSDIEPAATPRIQVIRCGVDAGKWQSTIPRPSRNGALRVLSVCRLVEKKGVDLVIQGLSEMQSKHGIAWKLSVAGDGPEREALEKLANELECADNIEWLGFVDNHRIPLLLDTADVFALACRVDQRGDRDGIPVVLMEAMALGVPVVSGRLPAIEELVEHGRTGILVNADDPTEVAHEFARLAGDATLCDSLATAARERVVEEFALDVNIDRLQCAITDAIEGGRS